LEIKKNFRFFLIYGSFHLLHDFFLLLYFFINKKENIIIKTKVKKKCMYKEQFLHNQPEEEIYSDGYSKSILYDESHQMAD
jgi:hypothetical protein